MSICAICGSKRERTMKKEYNSPSIDVLELGSMSQLMAGSITNVDSPDIDPVVDGSNEPGRAKETIVWFGEE